jgi:hypothetical protein
MLPDFCSIVGARITGTGVSDLREGIAFHHRVDELFHECAPFRETSLKAFAWLEANGVSRGAGRALAHVGVELLFDRVLARDERYRQAYETALCENAEGVRWSTEGTHAARKCSALLAQLRVHGVDLHACSLEILAKRLERILARRPRLALLPEEVPQVLGFLAAFEHSVERRTAEMMSAITVESELR